MDTYFNLQYSFERELKRLYENRHENSMEIAMPHKKELII